MILLTIQQMVMAMFEKHRGSKQTHSSSKDSASLQGWEASVVGETPVSIAPESVHSGSRAMIGPTIKIKGDISGDENLIIEGMVDGSVDLDGHELSIGNSGHVTANVKATVVRIQGEVRGDIVGREKVVLSRSGNVLGNIVAPRVTLEDGAKFKGSIDMDPGDVASASPLPASLSLPAGNGLDSIEDRAEEFA
jgi:cytoskeletal protein CcmA (bactofilin family)